MNTIFMGTPEFAIPSLQVTCDITNLRAIFTQPDKKRGRGQKISFSPVKKFAIEHSIDVYQPQSLKDSQVLDLVKSLSPDLIVVVAYGKILPPEILKIPQFGCINVHASLLPKYRGAAPIQWAIMNGEKSTGITTMKMDAGLDTGDILLQCKVDIDSEMSFDELHDKLKTAGASCLKDTIENLGNINPKNQIHTNASYSHIITHNSQHISWLYNAWKKKKKKKRRRQRKYRYNIIST